MVKVYPNNIKNEDYTYNIMKSIVCGLLLCVCMCVGLIITIVLSVENNIENGSS